MVGAPGDYVSQDARSVILLIQDIDRPEVGFIAASQQPMVDTANAVASYLAEF